MPHAFRGERGVASERIGRPLDALKTSAGGPRRQKRAGLLREGERPRRRKRSAALGSREAEDRGAIGTMLEPLDPRQR